MAVFAGGSALAGAAQNPTWLVGARAVSIPLQTVRIVADEWFEAARCWLW
jgi:hypothetical protein